MTGLAILRPTAVKLVFLMEWVLFVLLALLRGELQTSRQILVASCPLLFFYLVACALALLSEHTRQLARGWRLLAVALSLTAVDQLTKAVIIAVIPYLASLPILNGWLHLAHLRNAHGSWVLSTLNVQGAGTVLLMIVVPVVMVFSIFCHRYYVHTQRQSVWADIAFIGLFAGFASWACDMHLRGHIVDFLVLPGLLSADWKDLFVTIGAAALSAEALDNPNISFRPRSWHQDSRELLQLAARLARFSAEEVRVLRQLFLRHREGPREPPKHGNPSRHLALVLLAVLVSMGTPNQCNERRSKARLYSAAQAALRAEQWDDAVDLLSDLVGQDPEYRQARALLAQALDNSMVYVPPGEFLMGSDTGDLDEHPQRAVYLDGFEIDKHEVTNVQYRRFMLATGHNPPQYWPDRYVDLRPARDPRWQGTEYPAGEALHPVVAVNWEDATAYCAWAGKRLPSEAEWEKAARGADGRDYVWGDAWDGDKANTQMTDIGGTQPVGSYPGGASPYGALEMAGNVWEWVADLYDRRYYTYAPDRNPPGPESGTGERLLRGGAWDSPPSLVRVSYRNATHCFGPNYRAGFRCARSSQTQLD